MQFGAKVRPEALIMAEKQPVNAGDGRVYARWMLLHVLTLGLAIGGPAPAAAQPRPAPKTYNETASAKETIAAAVEAAAADDVRVLVNFGANDDGSSVAFAQALKTPAVSKAAFFADEYKVANIDVGHRD